MSDTTENQPASAEQAADLAAMQQWAAGESAPAALGAQPQAEEIKPPSAQAVALAAMLLGIVRPIGCYLAPSLKKAPEELWAPIPDGIAAVIDHYGVTESEMLRNPWARLALSCAPLAAFAVMNAEPEKPDEPARIAAPEQPAGSNTVTIGAPMPEAAEA